VEDLVKVSLFGLGYVGCVSAACFAEAGHRVVGVDVNPLKVDILNSGQSPIVEEGVAALIMEAVTRGTLRATGDARDAVLGTDISLLCVGTPSNRNGSLDLRHVYNVARQIGEILRDKGDFHVVVIRSTTMPGTAEEITTIIADASGKEPQKDFTVVSNPEFLREGSAVADFKHPPLTLIGGEDQRGMDAVAELYAHLEAPVVREVTRVSEMIKYVNNAWHATKVTFANEVGNLSKAMGIDSHRVMAIVCQDTKLNLSPVYMKPGFAFGGSCLPKDLRALTFRSRELDVSSPMLESLMQSNQLQVHRVIEQLLTWRRRKLGFLGLSFKGGTDDLRESPIVEVVETMLGKGYDCRIFDSNVSLAKIFGANKEYIEKEIPHLDRLMSRQIEDVVDHAEVLVIANRHPDFERIVNNPPEGKIILDLVRITQDVPPSDDYHGICW
jgi:GDP-mannose 6-dehydrogenase